MAVRSPQGWYPASFSQSYDDRRAQWRTDRRTFFSDPKGTPFPAHWMHKHDSAYRHRNWRNSPAGGAQRLATRLQSRWRGKAQRRVYAQQRVMHAHPSLRALREIVPRHAGTRSPPPPRRPRIAVLNPYGNILEPGAPRPLGS